MSGTDLRRAALSGARWTMAARVGLQLITWPITILVMRLLDPQDYGLFAIAMVVAGFITLFSELGLTVAIVQAQQLDDAIVRAACTAILALNSIVAMLILVLAPWAAQWFGEPGLRAVMQVLTLELVLSSLAAMPQALLERQLRFKQLSLAMMAAGICGSGVTLLGAWMGLGVWSLVFGYLVLAAVRSVLLIAFHGGVIWPALQLSLAPIRPLVRFSSHVITGRVLWYWYGQADQVILARLAQASLLGFYNVASQLAMLPASKAMEAINKVAMPILARLRDDPPGLRQAHQRLLGLVAAYGFSICWGLAGVAPEFVALVLGEKWHAATVPLVCLSLVAPLRMLSALHNTITTAVGAPQAATKELGFASVAIPAAVFVGAWSGGLDGAAMAWLVVFPIVYLLSNALTSAAVGNRTRDGLRPVVAPVLSGLAMLGAIGLVRLQFGGEGSVLWLLLATQIASGALAFALSLWLFAPALVRDVRSLTRELFHPASARSQPS